MSEAYRVPAVVSAIRILAELANAGDGAAGVSPAALTRETGISKSTMHNLLATLEAEGFVRRAPAGGYQLGGALVALGAAAARQVRPLSLAIRRLPELAFTHGLSMAVGQLTPDGHAQIIERAYPTGPVHVGIRVGSRYGPFEGAIGKCLLADLPAQRAEELVRSRPIPAYTDRTLTDPGSLLEEITRVRERGWGASIGELNSNVAVATLVADADGTTVGLLLALGFPGDLDQDGVVRVAGALRVAADEITVEVGGEPRASRSSIQREELV